jgi:hypothetical protein
MESGSRSFDVKTLMRLLHKAPETQTHDISEKTGEDACVRPRDLDAYVYQRLFLPIAAEKPVPLEGLDFGKITYEDIGDLANALDNCDVFALFNLGDVFRGIRPAVSAKQMFI